MQFARLVIDDLRCFQHLDVVLQPGINVFVGGNGTGKTSLLEAAHLLSHGRSFRASAADALLRQGAASWTVHAEIRRTAEQTQLLGLTRHAGGWQARVDGQPVATLAALIEHCAVICFEPGSHALIAGPAEERRRFVDWGVFHVEHEFQPIWRRYRRALRQRNALLRSAAADVDLTPWEQELALRGEQLDAMRRRYLGALEPLLETLCAALIPELGAPVLLYRRGWPTGESLAAALRGSRLRDQALGHTRPGPHRADWSLSFAAAPSRAVLSRGQAKLSALACLLSQAELHDRRSGDAAVLCMDDLASELDAAHLEAVADRLQRRAGQVLVTGTAMPPVLAGSTTRFHVEHGTVRQA